MENLHTLVYLSSATKELPQAELAEILAVSRKNNKARNITGILVYCAGNILQVLEGSEDDLHQLYNKIEADKRHRNCIILQDRAKKSRDFTDWSMGFKSVTKNEFDDVEGYFDLRSHNKTQQRASSNFLQELLNDFITQNR